jgi:hypothetical protein
MDDDNVTTDNTHKVDRGEIICLASDEAIRMLQGHKDLRVFKLAYQLANGSIPGIQRVSQRRGVFPHQSDPAFFAQRADQRRGRLPQTAISEDVRQQISGRGWRGDRNNGLARLRACLRLLARGPLSQLKGPIRRDWSNARQHDGPTREIRPKISPPTAYCLLPSAYCLLPTTHPKKQRPRRAEPRREPLSRWRMPALEKGPSGGSPRNAPGRME